MSNLGVAPADPGTAVGQLRTNIGDLSYVPLDPPETGFGDFEWTSDQELEELLILADDNISRATGYGLRKLATYLTMSAVNITTDDLRISTIERAKLMRDLASDWLASADDEDARLDSSYFDLIPFPGLRTRTDELAERVWPWTAM